MYHGMLHINRANHEQLTYSIEKKIISKYLPYIQWLLQLGDYMLPTTYYKGTRNSINIFPIVQPLFMLPICLKQLVFNWPPVTTGNLSLGPEARLDIYIFATNFLLCLDLSIYSIYSTHSTYSIYIFFDYIYSMYIYSVYIYIYLWGMYLLPPSIIVPLGTW